jgi:hypothetical protein
LSTNCQLWHVADPDTNFLVTPGPYRPDPDFLSDLIRSSSRATKITDAPDIRPDTGY